jgi:deaminated glutathione amidase
VRAAAVQLNATADKDRNLETAERLVRGAASEGARLIVLPEKWNVLGDAEALVEGAEPLDGPSVTAVRDWARELGVAICAGSIPERVAEGERLANTSALIAPDGEVAAVYRKIHMFDVDVGGVSYRESDTEDPGGEVVTGDVPGARVGLTICYDLRFPELYRILALRDARLITVPAAFTMETGRDHWEVLIRARAIENQLFVVAAGQIGEAPPHFRSYGRSMIVDPWGTVLATAPDAEGFVIADLRFDRLAEVRAQIPSLANRRPESYEWPQPTEAVAV